jgi:glycosyltransferase involved in cell wall biosynthesis
LVPRKLYQLVRDEMNKKKITMIAYSDYPTDTRVRREAETLASETAFQVRVITLKGGKSPRRISMGGVEIIEVNTAKYRGRNQLRYLLSYGNFFIKTLKQCTRLAIKREIGAVHIHNMPDSLVFAALLPKLLGKSITLDIHDTMPETFGSKFGNSNRLANWFLKLEESFSCRFADRLICVNDIQKDKLVSRGIPPDKITVLMNVPDPKIFYLRKVNQEEDKSSDGFNLVYHGTIAHRLGVDLILEALHFLREQIPGIRLHLWGRKEEARTILGARIKEDHLEERVVINEAIPAEQLPEELVKMDLGIIGNRNNAATELMLPVKMMEYMALKIPVVAPRTRAIRHYFGEDLLMYFEPENVESMASAIYTMYADKELRQKKSDKAYEFLQTISWDKQKEMLFNMYQDL